MTHVTAFLVLITVVLTSLSGLAGEPEQAQDKIVFEQLTKELRELHAKSGEAFTKALAEARDNGGEASLSSKADILAMRDQVDRKSSRLTVIALRHGWHIPQFSDNEKKSDQDRPVDHKDEMFGAVDHMIRAAFSREAAQIAAKVRLPVISLKAEEKEAKNNGQNDH